MSDLPATHEEARQTGSASTSKTSRIKKSDLPLSCPPASIPGWSHHPRIFLDFNGKQATCPYCGARYELD